MAKGAGRPNARPWRLVIRVLVAIAAAVAPYLLLVSSSKGSVVSTGLLLIALICSPFAGSLVFVLLAERKPLVMHGVGFSIALGLAGGIYWSGLASIPKSVSDEGFPTAAVFMAIDALAHRRSGGLGARVSYRSADGAGVPPAAVSKAEAVARWRGRGRD